MGTRHLHSGRDHLILRCDRGQTKAFRLRRGKFPGWEARYHWTISPESNSIPGPDRRGRILVTPQISSKDMSMHTSENSSGSPQTQSGRAVIESFEQFERRIWDFSKLFWFFTLLLPIALTLVIVIFVAMIQGQESAYKFLIAAAATAFILGRFSILFGQSGHQTPPPVEEGSFWHEMYHELAQTSALELFLLVTYMDIVVAAFLAFHLGFMFRIPFFGPKAADLIGDTQTLLHDRPWVKRASVLVLIVFVIFPTSSTGSVGGSIFGNLMGLSRFATFASIVTGSVLGNGLMYLLAGQFDKYIDKDAWWLKLGGVAFCLVLVFFLERRYRHMKKVAIAEKEAAEKEAKE